MEEEEDSKGLWVEAKTGSSIILKEDKNQVNKFGKIEGVQRMISLRNSNPRDGFEVPIHDINLR